ncbi:MAG: glycine--tRNA ligase subunit beta [Deltaproteobacteria bacterium]|nr:glycine--tRNA ligase subunit beta [Deltaproteobacteria bacterium]MBW2132099.1 glycine--tRNA ligase subunit beta [Deltaproteobacteria bacterium]
MDTLLLEIGTEEIPAGYIEPALDALSQTIVRKLDAARIVHGGVNVYGTPKRLAVEIADVAEKQTPLSVEMIGPPKKVGFDDQGRPTVAAEKFAEKAGVAVAKLIVKETEKGAYLCAQKMERGKSSRALLSTILPETILATPFPKSMRWGTLSISFARPIHTVLALLGNKIIPFTVGDIKSGRMTLGHRFMASGRIRVDHPKEYIKKLREAHVLADIRARKKSVRTAVEKAAGKIGGRVLEDDALLDTVTHLVEYPVPSTGRFDDAFLALPPEILITAMRRHQKYFAVEDDKGCLMPHFIAVNNTRTRNPSLVATGHERVLRARLSDARFFFNSDLSETFDQRVEKLKGVLFQSELGTMHEKIQRVRDMAAYLADAAAMPSDVIKDVKRAAWLCKADLVSQVVGEFPELQGIMGRVYAEKSGEPERVARALEEHYRPTHSGGVLPGDPVGALLSIADKLDSICGCFSVGLVPTGASDPYALRRQGIGIVLIMLSRNFQFSLEAAVQKSLSLFPEAVCKDAAAGEKIFSFLQNRMVHLLAEEGYAKDVIQAVTTVSSDCVPDVWARVKALDHLKKAPDFEPLAVAFKRVVNIIKQAGGGAVPEVKESLFSDKSEKALYAAYQKTARDVEQLLKKGAYEKALVRIASLREPVDAFFDAVLVMTKDGRVRLNRLAVLSLIAGLFERIADFSKIST